jgi:hypothetical protein
MWRQASGDWQTVPSSLYDGHSTTFVHHGLNDYTHYDYRVYASNGFGDSGYGTADATTPLAVPKNLAAEVVSGHEINLTWSKDPTSKAVIFDIYQNGGYLATVNANADQTNCSYTATGPFTPSPAVTSYSFQVVARYYGAALAYSNEAIAYTRAWPDVPSIPTVAVVSESQVNVTWTDGDDETGYTVQWKAGNGTWGEPVSIDQNIASYPVNGLMVGQTSYSFRVATVRIWSEITSRVYPVWGTAQ